MASPSSPPTTALVRTRAGYRAALRGIAAAAVGTLLAALCQPVWTSAITAPAEFALAIAAFGLLALWTWALWLVGMLTALAAEGLARLHG